MAQYQAGYFIEGIKRLFVKDKDADKIDGLLHQLSYFDLYTDSDLTKSVNDSVFSVFNNLIIRGLPTIPSAFIEDFLSATFSKTRKRTSEDNKLEYNFLNDDSKKSIIRALHIIEPRLNLKAQTKTKSKSEKENIKNQFLNEVIPLHFGEYLLQLIDNNRSIEEILKFSENKKSDFENVLQSENYKFIDDITDFSIEIPFIEKEQKGIIINIDDSQAVDKTDYKKEEQKSEFLKNLLWNNNTKIKKDDFQNIEVAIEQLSFFTFNSFFDNLKKNYESPLYKEEDGLDALQITLSPLGIARIQKTLIEFILAGRLNLDAEEWNIAVIERDVPCAFVAIEDFKHHLNRLFLLEGKNRKLPKIVLSIFYSEEFENAEINILYQGEKNLIKSFSKIRRYDLLIDISVLRRVDCDNEKIKTGAKNLAIIRSVKKINSVRNILTDNLIAYKPVIFENITKTEDEEDAEIEIQDALRFFLKSIFRKNEFADKQLEFINQAIQLKNTVGIISNSEQNTIACQLAALLQPGISLIINPVMSSMKEMFDNLQEAGIDLIYYINSSQTKLYQKSEAIRKFQNGESLFTFVSADRFQTIEFRQILNEMFSKEKYFAYTIIDDAHCMSEWSHDYRESYNLLPTVLKNYCKTKNLPEIPLLATTSYASYDVIINLSSKLKTENILISDKIEYLPKNIKFDARKVVIEEIDEIKENETIKNGIEVKKQLLLNKIVEENFNQKKSKTLVVCSNKKGILSVDTDKNDGIFSKLLNNFKNLKISKFEGTIDDNFYSVGSLKSRESYQNYKKFNKNETDLLVANKTIGIGLNINNLEKIIHLNYPLSFENFIQINSRINLKSKDTSLSLLYSNQKTNYKDKEFKADNIGRINAVDIEKESTVDFETQNNFFKKIYSNRYKDELILNELLTKITFTKEKPQNFIRERIEEEFNEKISFTSQPGTNPYQLHIDRKSGKSIGYIDFKNNKIVVKASNFEKEFAEHLLIFAKAEIEKQVPQREDIIKWFETERQIREIDGIDVQLKNINVGEELVLNISFTNTYFDTLTAIIRKFVDENFNESLIQIYNESFDFNEFKLNLLNKLNINISKLTTNTLLEFKENFDRLRGFYDTQRVVNKLFIINIISDYSIDFSKQTFKLTLTKKDDNELIHSLYSYTLLYTSKEQAIKIFEEINNYNGNTIISKIVYYFNNFWFDNVVSKRSNSMNILSDLAQKEFIDENFTGKLVKLHNNYFTEFYNNELTYNSLYVKTNNFTNNSFSIIEYFIAETGCLKNKWKHLFKSTGKLIYEKKESSVLRILNGYSEILLNDNNVDIIDIALSKITDGFAEMAIYEGNKMNDVSEKENWLIEKIYDQNLDLKKKIDEILILKSYTSWLKLFNKKFLAKD